ncbi:MAG: hypothetical protein AB7I59_23665 [Geminicoccaceae bacterium]
MSAEHSPAWQTGSGVDDARSHQCDGPLAPPSEDRGEFAALHTAVTSDWGPRDAYERRWVMELVTSMWRQDRLRGLELATLAAAAAECPPSEATVRKLDTFARYGSRIDKDIGRALQALRVLRKRPDTWIEELQDGTSEPGAADAATPSFTNEISSCTHEPESRVPQEAKYTNELTTRTPEPERRLNRRERRALAAMRRGRAA